MKIYFRFDNTGINFAIGVFSFCFLLMIVPAIVTGTFQKILPVIGLFIIFLAIVWLGLAKGTYILLDAKRDLFITSGFFFSKSIPLSEITKIETRGMFGGVMNKIVLIYRDRNGNTNTLNSMTRESFKSGDFVKFAKALQSLNKSISIPESFV